MPVPPEVYLVLATGCVTAIPALIIAYMTISANSEKAARDRKHEEAMAVRTELVKLRLGAGTKLLNGINDLYIALNPVAKGAFLFSRAHWDEPENKKRIAAINSNLKALKKVKAEGELCLGPKTILAYHAFVSAFDEIRFRAFVEPEYINGCQQVMLDLMDGAYAEVTKALQADLESASILLPTAAETRTIEKTERARALARIEARVADNLIPSATGHAD